MKYEVYTWRFDVNESLYASFKASSDEEAIRRFNELKDKESLSWESMRMVAVQVERKVRRVASLDRKGGNKEIVVHEIL